jgi:hypothetical protein
MITDQPDVPASLRLSDRPVYPSRYTRALALPGVYRTASRGADLWAATNCRAVFASLARAGFDGRTQIERAGPTARTHIERFDRLERDQQDSSRVATFPNEYQWAWRIPEA